MAIKKRDFQKLLNTIKEVQGKLPCDETCADLRDALNLSLLQMHKYYKQFRIRCQNGGNFLDKSISLTSSLTGAASPVSPYIAPVDTFDWKWLNLDVKKLSASFGHGDKINYVPEIFNVIRDNDFEKMKSMIGDHQDHVNELDAIGRTTAMYAIQGGTEQYIECLKFLIANGVDLQQQSNDGFSCLHMACYYGYKEIVEILVREKVELNVRDAEERTPLHFAAAYCSTDILEILLLNGADVMIQDREGLTAAMWACHFDQLENLQLLLNYEKRINSSPEAAFQIVDACGASILHWAVTRSSNIHCFKHLINAETVHLCDDNGKSIFLWAVEHGCLLACEEIFNVSSDDIIDDVDNLGRSALHLATLGGHGEVVDLLLNKGASYDHCDSQGATALDYAINRKLNYCLMVFLSYQKYRERMQNTKLPTSHAILQTSTVEERNLKNGRSSELQDSHKNKINEIVNYEPKEFSEEVTSEQQKLNERENENQQNTGGKQQKTVELHVLQSNDEAKMSDKQEDLNQHRNNEPDVSDKLDVQDAIGFEVEGDVDEDIEFEYEEDYEEEIDKGKKQSEANQLDLENKNAKDGSRYASTKSKMEDGKISEVQTNEDNKDSANMAVGNKEEEDDEENNENKSIEESIIDLEDQMIVLVAHHGSDDDMVIEYGNDNNQQDDSEKLQLSIQSEAGDSNEAVKLDPVGDRDLYETSRLSPRVESVTKLMETNTMPANQSASVNISVSSLCSDSEEEIIAGQGETQIESTMPLQLFDDHNQIEHRNPFPKQRLQRQSHTRIPLAQQIDDNRPSSSHGKRKDKKSNKKDRKSSPRRQSEETMQQRIPIGPLEPMKPLQPVIAPQGFPAQRNSVGNSTYLGNISPKSQDFMLPSSSPRGNGGFSSPSESPRTPKSGQLPSPRFGFEARDSSLSHIPRPNSPKMGSHSFFPRPPLGR